MPDHVTDAELLATAKAAAKNAYAPYSNFRVGAAVLAGGTAQSGYIQRLLGEHGAEALGNPGRPFRFTGVEDGYLLNGWELGHTLLQSLKGLGFAAVHPPAPHPARFVNLPHQLETEQRAHFAQEQVCSGQYQPPAAQ